MSPVSSQNSPLFEWLVRYHYEINLPSHLKYLSQKESVFVEQGLEHEHTKGCLIVENGDSLVERLQRDNIILNYSPPRFVSVGSYTQFAEMLTQNQQKDGGFFYDGLHKRIARVKFGNSTPMMIQARQKGLSLLSPDFFLYGKTEELTLEDLDEYPGTKTDLAMILPVAYSGGNCTVHAYQIKRTAYNEAGMGKVVAFGPQGLEQEFFFHYEPRKKGVSVDGVSYPLVGIQRVYEYEPRVGRVVKVREELRDFLDEMKAA